MAEKFIDIVGTSFARDRNSKCLMETNPSKAEEYRKRREALKKRFDNKDEEIAELKGQVDALWDAINSLMQDKKK